MALECSSSQANPPEALSRRLELVDPGADLELHVHRDDVLQEGVDIIIWERGAPLAAQVLPLIKAIVKLADIANPVEAEEPFLPRQMGPCGGWHYSYDGINLYVDYPKDGAC